MRSHAASTLAANATLEIVEVLPDDDDEDKEEHAKTMDPTITEFPIVALMDVFVDKKGLVIERKVSRAACGHPLAALMGGKAIARRLRQWMSSTIRTFVRPSKAERTFNC